MPATKTVNIENFAYDPATLTIELGDSVKWINKDNMVHTATRTDQPAFDTGSLHHNQESGEIQFTELSSGTGFGYRCTPHPFMEGSIIVTPRANNGGSY